MLFRLYFAPFARGKTHAHIGAIDGLQTAFIDNHGFASPGDFGIGNDAPPAVFLQIGDQVRLPLFQRAAVADNLIQRDADDAQQFQLCHLCHGKPASMFAVHHFGPCRGGH